MTLYHHRASGTHLEIEPFLTAAENEYVFGSWSREFIEIMENSIIDPELPETRRRSLVSLGELGEEAFKACITKTVLEVRGTAPRSLASPWVKRAGEKFFSECFARMGAIAQINDKENIDILLLSLLVNPELQGWSDFHLLKDIIESYGIYDVVSLVRNGVTVEEIKAASDDNVDPNLILSLFNGVSP